MSQNVLADPAGSPPGVREASKPPLFVDLDGTLIKSDTLVESVLLLARKSPAQLLLVPLALAKGKAHLKTWMADRVRPTAALLPYRKEFLDYLKAEHQAGRELILISAADQRIVDEVSAHLGIFRAAYGSSRDNNLKGQNKVTLINSLCKGAPFDYAGNERADLKIWKHANSAVVVSRSKSLLEAAKANAHDAVSFRDGGVALKPLVELMRPHQWLKNLLVFAPFLLAHKKVDALSVERLLSVFFCLSFAASAVYVANDLYDIESDRRHERKRNRPVASGNASVISASFLSLTLVVLSLALSAVTLPPVIFFLLIAYLVLNLAYSFVFKNKLLLDILVLAGFYTLRIFAGSIASEVPISRWFLAFSSFFFLGLACLKRFVEIKKMKFQSLESVGRDYCADDLEVIQSAGMISGMMSVLVFFLYLAESQVADTLYSSSQLLWLIGPMIIYWTVRAWIFARRGKMHDDPVWFAITDRVTWVLGFLTVGLVILASLL
ncbi:MAG TPA: UbiA family prenyltransferase [Verrucomicrobiae bacterium]|jgi:4-hydroxybenzoate polyprenyltransferase|nr:UbiA family prenyltransferase [Verrucomicrobiae bacterium]